MSNDPITPQVNHNPDGMPSDLWNINNGTWHDCINVNPFQISGSLIYFIKSLTNTLEMDLTRDSTTTQQPQILLTQRLEREVVSLVRTGLYSLSI
ncbi:unnamed protein product [Gordionus sp. m RMFG-2023]